MWSEIKLLVKSGGNGSWKLRIERTLVCSIGKAVSFQHPRGERDE